MSIATRRNPWHVLGIVGILLALAALPALAFAGPGNSAPLQGATDVVEVTNQAVQGGSVTVNRVLAAQAGWMVIHADEGGNPGPVLGQTAVKQGENNAVAVKLSKDVAVNSGLWAMLHIDAGTKGTYEFPGPDAPVFLNNKAVQTKFTVTTPTQTPTPVPTPTSDPNRLPATGAEPVGNSVLLLIVAGACVLLGMGLRLKQANGDH